MTTPPASPIARKGPAFACRACGHATATRYWEQQDRLHGLPGVFEYGECARCGALSIRVVPDDLGRFYPVAYHRFERARSRLGSIDWRVVLLFGFSPNGRALVKAVVGDRDARVLDVGCGNGRLLHELFADGYRGLCGVDPLLPAEQEHTQPFPLSRKGIRECEGGWDVIMYHHVLEHVADPREEMAAAAARLRPGGALMVRVPLADSWARRHFGIHWVAWDPPRHLWVPTVAAIRALAAGSGLVLERIVHDSTGYQVWASRVYRRDGRMDAAGSPVMQRRAGLLARSGALVAWHLWARWLNWRGQGDQACFVLRRPEPGATTAPGGGRRA